MGLPTQDYIAAYRRSRFFAHSAGRGLKFNEALDDVIYAKILPKLKGEQSGRLTIAFAGCQKALKETALSRLLKKADEMQQHLATTGSARLGR